MEKFGIKSCADAFFAVFVDFTDADVARVKAELLEVAHVELKDLNQHIEFQDVPQTVHLFDLKQGEKNQADPNSILTSIYTKLALKNL